MSFWQLFFEFASGHPVAAFFLVISTGWATAGIIRAVMLPWVDDMPDGSLVNLKWNSGEDE